MCRHLAYLGPPVAARPRCCSSPPHALLRQSWAPRDMRGGGTVNADGFGVGWYAEGDPVPVRYRRAGPLWADPSFADLARVVRSGAVLAAVRTATVGMPVRAAAAPFAAGRWLFSHNGVVRGWPDVGGRARRRRCRSTDLLDPGRPHRLGAAVGAGARTGCAPATSRAEALADAGRRGRRGRARLPAEPAAHRRRARSSATAWDARAVGARRAADAAPSSPPNRYDDDPAGSEVPDRHLRRGPPPAHR